MYSDGQDVGFKVTFILQDISIIQTKKNAQLPTC